MNVMVVTHGHAQNVMVMVESHVMIAVEMGKFHVMNVTVLEWLNAVVGQVVLWPGILLGTLQAADVEERVMLKIQKHWVVKESVKLAEVRVRFHVKNAEEEEK